MSLMWRHCDVNVYYEIAIKNYQFPRKNENVVEKRQQTFTSLGVLNTRFFSTWYIDALP